MEPFINWLQAFGETFVPNFITTTCAVFFGTILAMNYLNGKEKK